MTPYQKHRKKWEGCTRCDLCNRRNNVVLARGKVPAEILFIGEAPGVSENADSRRRPFHGPAGKLLDRILRQAIDGQYDYALTNLVACIPLDSEGIKTAEPSAECIEACRPRLLEFANLVKPNLVVLVGKLAAKHYNDLLGSVRTISIIHPAAILRMDLPQKNLAVHRATVVLSDAIVLSDAVDDLDIPF